MLHLIRPVDPFDAVEYPARLQSERDRGNEVGKVKDIQHHVSGDNTQARARSLLAGVLGLREGENPQADAEADPARKQKDDSRGACQNHGQEICKKGEQAKEKEGCQQFRVFELVLEKLLRNKKKDQEQYKDACPRPRRDFEIGDDVAR